MKSYMPKLFNPSVLCARSELSKQGTCQGDSGSPLWMFDPRLDIYLQVGIVAGGITLDQCGSKNYPSVFTSLNHPKNLDFVEFTAELNRNNFNQATCLPQLRIKGRGDDVRVEYLPIDAWDLFCIFLCTDLFDFRSIFLSLVTHSPCMLRLSLSLSLSLDFNVKQSCP